MKAHPLTESIFGGNEAELRRILEADPACLNEPESGGLTALMLCAIYKQPELARLLLARGAHLGAVDRWSMSAMHHAARAHCTELVTQLIEAGANVNQQDASGNTPLLHGVLCYRRDGDGSTFEALLKAGADATIRNRWSDSPIEIARRSESGAASFFEGVGDPP